MTNPNRLVQLYELSSATGFTGPTGAASTVTGYTGPTGLQGSAGAASTVTGYTGPAGATGAGNVSDIIAVIDGGGSVITAGTYGWFPIDYACTINQVTMLADVSGSIVVEIWKCTYAQFDAGGTHPVTGDKLNQTGTVSTISSTYKNQDATLTSWNVTINAGDILAFHV